MKNKMGCFMSGVKVAGKHIVAIALIGMMVLSLRVEAGVLEPGGPNLELLSKVPELTAERESLPTNGALRDFLLDFIDMYIVDKQGENQGGPRSIMDDEAKRLSDLFLQGYRHAMGMDTASRALGLNDDGMDMFYNSKIIDFFTIANEREDLGTFWGDIRMVSIAINTMHDGVLSGLPPEQIATALLYEIDGRGRGWEPHLNFALVEHFGLPNTHIRSGLAFDPTMEIAVSEAAGGIHTLFEAADSGEAAVRDHMNANFKYANPYFDFDYDAWKMTRTVDFIIRTQWRTYNGRYALRVFRERGGRHNDLQRVIHQALDTTLTPEERKESALRVNRYVAILAEIGMSLRNVWWFHSTDDTRLPVVDLSNPGGGIVGITGHFPHMIRHGD